MSRLPVPLSQFVLKVHSRCDLACDHCYVYESADQTWRGRPMVMSDEVISRTAQRIAEHLVLLGMTFKTRRRKGDAAQWLSCWRPWQLPPSAVSEHFSREDT